MNNLGNAARFSAPEDDVFARIADDYDRLCDVFSLGIHRLWKNHMATQIADRATGQVLDIASGTGDIPLRVLRRLGWRTGSIERLIVSDICPQMLSLAERKLTGKAPILDFAVLDAHDLAEIQSASIDVYSISFAMKICDRERVLAEALRVLKPGGLFFCLEAARIPIEIVHRAYLGYMDWCLPLIGRLAADGDTSAYEYLLRGIHGFPDQAGFVKDLCDSGFEEVGYENLTFGIVAMHVGRKPMRGRSPSGPRLS